MTDNFKTLIIKGLKKLEVDRSVSFGMMSLAWMLGAAPLTASLVARQFSPEVQGYYYTFRSLLAMQTFFSLGLGTVIIQFTSHEWTKLKMDDNRNIIGDAVALSRLRSLMKFSMKWFFVGSAMLILTLGGGGYVFFSGFSSGGIPWVGPWFFLSLLTGLIISLTPIWSVLEGTSQISRVYRFRFFSAIFMNIASWAGMLMGANLWVLCFANAVALLYAIVFLWRRYYLFCKSLIFQRHGNEKIHWFEEVWPMQWRVALMAAAGYFFCYFFTPVLFKYHGAVVAGQMGMTWTFVGILPSLSAAWVNPKGPLFGMMIARKEYDELDRIFWRLTKVVLVGVGLVAVLMWAFVFVLYKMKLPIMERLLSPLPTGIFLAAQFFLSISYPMATYMRAHKKEPLMFLFVCSSGFVCLSNLILGKYFSATGMAWGYFTVNLLALPVISFLWYRNRRLWHADKEDSPGLVNEEST